MIIWISVCDRISRTKGKVSAEQLEKLQACANAIHPIVALQKRFHEDPNTFAVADGESHAVIQRRWRLLYSEEILRRSEYYSVVFDAIERL